MTAAMVAEETAGRGWVHPALYEIGCVPLWTCRCKSLLRFAAEEVHHAVKEALAVLLRLHLVAERLRQLLEQAALFIRQACRHIHRDVYIT